MEYFMKLKQSSMIGVGLLVVATASASEPQVGQSPTFYQCSGKDVKVTLSIGSKAEVDIGPTETVMNLKLGKKNYSFKEADMVQESTLIGELWEVAVEQVPDSHVRYATLVIPDIGLTTAPLPAKSQLPFKSQLVLTKVLTSLAGKSSIGVTNSSKYVDLSCEAMLVF